MAIARLIEENDASAEIKAIYTKIKQHFNLDFVPNVFKAVASNPEALKQTFENIKQDEEYWGKETSYLIGLAVDVTNGCDYLINFDAAMLKQLGYDDAKIERLITSISLGSFFDRYVTGIQLEPDVRPDIIKPRKAA